MTVIAKEMLDSSALRRAKFQGFVFTRYEVSDEPFGAFARGEFTCVCGRRESFRIALPPKHLANPAEFDAADWLTRYGSFSREHLIGDGYSQDEVERIIGLGLEFDDAEQDRREPDPRRARSAIERRKRFLWEVGDSDTMPEHVPAYALLR